jgi:hypothetical protein
MERRAMKPDLAFAFVVESGDLESKAVLLARSIRWQDLAVALTGLLVLLLASVAGLRLLTEVLLDDSEIADTPAMAVAAAVVVITWTLIYGLETLENFPLSSFRRASSQVRHTLTAPAAPYARRATVLLAWPLNLIVPWGVGVAGGVAASHAFDSAPDAAFLAVLAVLTGGFALAYRAEI